MENTKKSKFKIKNAVISVLSVIAVGAVLYGIGYSTGILQKSLTALKVADHKISALEYRFYYTDTKSNLISQYGDAMKENGTDLSKPLEDQSYTADMTWKEYLNKSTVSELTEIYAIYDVAKKANYEMDDATKESIKSYITQIEEAAKLQNTTADKFIKSIYGKNIGVKELEEFITKRYYAVGYMQAQQADFKPTEDEIKSHYENNKNDFDVVNYNIFQFAWEVVKDNEAETAKNKAEAKAKADEMLSKVTDSASFGKLAHEYAAEDKKPYYAQDNVTLIKEGLIRSDAGPVAAWFADSSRVSGDKAVIEGTTDYTVILFNSRFLQQYNSVSVRHILIPTQTAQSAEEKEAAEKYNAEAKAKAKAQEILNKYLAGEKNEDNFAKLAKEESLDGGSADNGGLYEEIGKNQMADAFEKWCFNPENKNGDTGIIQTEHGYHVMYYIGEGRPYWMVQAQSKMSENFFNEIFDKATKDVNVKQNSFAMSMAY